MEVVLICINVDEPGRENRVAHTPLRGKVGRRVCEEGRAVLVGPASLVLLPRVSLLIRLFSDVAWE